MVYVSGSCVRLLSLVTTASEVTPVAVTLNWSSTVLGGSSPPESGPDLQALNAPVALTITTAHNTARHENFIPPPALRTSTNRILTRPTARTGCYIDRYMTKERGACCPT